MFEGIKILSMLKCVHGFTAKSWTNYDKAS